jgi:hypothetical protein
MDIAILLSVINSYALEEQMRQRRDALLRQAAEARQVREARRQAAAQIARPDEAQYGARIVRLSSLPAWSRGSSVTKSTERGRL